MEKSEVTAMDDTNESQPTNPWNQTLQAANAKAVTTARQQFTQRARMLFTLLGSKNVLVLLHINWSRNSRIPKGICSIGRSMNLEI